MNKSVVLKDYNGDVCYPKVNKNNIIGYPDRPSGDVKIFFGFGEPSSNALNYKNIEVNDLYFDMNLNGKFGIYYRCVQIDNNNIRWDYYCDYILSDRDPITGNIAYWYSYNKILPLYKAGLIWCNTTTGELFLSKPIESYSNIPSWINLTDTYSKSEVNSFISNINNIYNKMDRIEDTIADSVINIQDSSNNKIPEIKIMGKSEQVNTNGHQLSDLTEDNYFKKVSSVVMGTNIKVSKGSIINAPNGTPLSSSAINTRFLYWVFDNIEVGKTYTIKTENNGGAFGSFFSKYNPNPTSSSDRISVLANGLSYTYTFTAESDVVYVLELRSPSMPEGGVISTPTTMTIILSEGSTAKEWEEYTGKQHSPSIDYPQQIVDVTSEQIEVKKRNLLTIADVNKQNLFKVMSTYIYNTTTNEYEITCTESGDIQLGDYRHKGQTSTEYSFNNMVIKTRIEEGKTYKISSKNGVFTRFLVFIYDDNRKVLLSPASASTVTITAPSGSKWLGVRADISNGTSGTVYKDMIMVSADGDATYEEPMTPQSANLTKTLRGIPVTSGGNYTDENNQQWICDTIERYKDGTGKLIQRIARASTDVRAQIMKQTSSKNNIYNIRWNHTNTPTAPKPIYDFYAVSNMKTESFLFKTNQEINAGEEGAAIFSNGSASWILKCGCTLNKFPTLEDFTTWVDNNPFDVVYAIETPIETSLTAEELAELDLSTYKPVTNIISNTDVEVTYVADTKNWIDQKCEQVQNAILSQGGNV